MNRKILLSFFIFIGVGFFLYYKYYKTQQKQQLQLNQDFASSATPVPAAKQNVAEPKKVQATDTAQSLKLSTPKSGKYAVKIPKQATTIQQETIKRDQYLFQNQTSLKISSADQNFILMKLRALKEKARSQSESVMGHGIFPIDTMQAQKVIIDEESYPVVYRESNGRLGFLTGVFLIQIDENSEAEKLALNYPMDLLTFDQSIKLASYKVRSGENLYDIYQQITQNERIRSITVEVLDSYKGR